MSIQLQFDVHLPNLLRELIEGHPSPGPLVTSTNILLGLLRELAVRAAEIDDPRLNVLMLRLSMYEVPVEQRLDRIREQMLREDEA